MAREEFDALGELQGQLGCVGVPRQGTFFTGACDDKVLALSDATLQGSKWHPNLGWAVRGLGMAVGEQLFEQFNRCFGRFYSLFTTVSLAVFA